MSAKTQYGGLKTTTESVQLVAGQHHANMQYVFYEIEDTIFDHVLPSNSIAVLRRIEYLLKDCNTNALENCRDDVQIRRAMWLLLEQFYGQLATIDLAEEWYNLYEARE